MAPFVSSIVQRVSAAGQAMRKSAYDGTSALFAAAVAIFAAGVEQGVIQGALSQMLDGLHIREAAGGMLVMMFSVGIISGSLLTAAVIGSLRERLVLLFGSLAAATAWIGHAVAAGYRSGLLLFLLGGLGHGALVAGASSAAASGGGGSAQRISLVQAFYMLGLGCGALAGGYASAAAVALPWIIEDWQAPFLASAGLSLLAAGGVATLSSRPALAHKCFPLFAALRNTLATPVGLLATGVIFLDIGAEASLGAWLSRYLQVARGAAASLAGWAVALFYAGMVCGRLIFGAWRPPVARTMVLLIGSAACCLLAVGLVYVGSPIALVLSPALGLAVAVIVPYGLAIVGAAASEEHTGAAVSAALAVGCCGGLIFPPLLGAAAEWSEQMRAAMMMPAGLFALTCLFALLLRRAGRDSEQ